MKLGFVLLLAAALGWMAQPATGEALDGASIALDRSRGGDCGICHELPAGDSSRQGNVGPSLADVGSRLGLDEIRQVITDPRALNPDSIMPRYGMRSGRYRMDFRWRGEPLLEPDEIDAIARWLAATGDD